jgi:SPP1 family predicted phage head-tail adaptor
MNQACRRNEPVEAGRLRHRVTIETPTRTVNATSGEKIPAFNATATVWAEVKPLTAKEQIRAGQTDVNATHVVSMRYRTDVTEQCRLNFGGRILNITGVVNVEERSAELQILATEVRS